VALSGTSAASGIATLTVAPSAFAIIVVVAFIQTGLAEELLFRGFMAKRLIALLGFQRGNALQALLFVAPHLLLFVGRRARRSRRPGWRSSWSRPLVWHGCSDGSTSGEVMARSSRAG
jgi:membrane protease YdiL (CAAX protease family)